MKRIAAMAALTVTMLAVPATGALASTGGSPGSGQGAGYGKPGTVQVRCPVVHRKVRVEVAYRLRHRHGKPVRVRIGCPVLPGKPAPKGCPPGVLRFDLDTGSSTLTEVSGPILAPFVNRGPLSPARPAS